MEDPFQKSQPDQTGQAHTLSGMTLGLRLLVAGSFIFIVTTIVAYVWYQRQTKDSLAELLPLDTVLYATVREPVWQVGQGVVSDLPFRQYLNNLQTDVVFAKTDLTLLLKESQQVAVALVLNEQGGLDWFYLFRLKDPKQSAPLFSGLPHYDLFQSNVLVVTLRPESLIKIQEVVQGQTFSLSSQTNFEDFGGDRVKVFVNVASVKTFFANQSGDLFKVLSQFVPEDIDLRLKHRFGRWLISTNSNFSLPTAHQDAVLLNLPEDFSFFVQAVNLSQLFTVLHQNQAGIASMVDQTVQTIGAIYDFDLSADIKNLFNQPLDLVVWDNQADNFLGFDYLAVWPNPRAEQLTALEELTKVVLSQKLPTQVERLLPDGSIVVELFANVDAWQYQQEDLTGGLKMHYLIEPLAKFELAYVVAGEYLLVSSSKDFLRRYLNQPGISLDTMLRQCHLEEADPVIIVNSNTVTSAFGQFLPDKTSIISNFSGCIVDN